MTIRKWEKINKENLDYRHRIQIERKEEELFNGVKGITIAPQTRKVNNSEKSFSCIESLAFVFKPPAIIFTKKPTFNKRSFKLFLKTSPSIGGLTLEANLKFNSKYRNALEFNAPIIMAHNYAGVESHISINDYHIKQYQDDAFITDLPIVNSYLLLLKPPAIADKVIKTKKSEIEVELQISPSAIGSFPKLNLTIERGASSSRIQKLTTLPLPKEGMEIQISLSNEFILKYSV